MALYRIVIDVDDPQEVLNATELAEIADDMFSAAKIAIPREKRSVTAHYGDIAGVTVRATHSHNEKCSLCAELYKQPATIHQSTE